MAEPSAGSGHGPSRAAQRPQGSPPAAAQPEAAQRKAPQPALQPVAPQPPPIRPRAPRSGRPRALRRQLVGVLVVVLLAFTCALAVTSTLALRSQLVSRLDQQLTQSSDRLATAPTRGGGGPGELPSGTQTPDPSTADQANPDQANPAQADPDQISPGPQPNADQPFFPWLGQETGTIVVTYVGGQVDRAGFLSGSGFTDLDDAQIADLEAVPADGRPHDVEVTDIGRYRAISTTTSHGEPSIVALSTADVTETVEWYLIVEAILAAVGVALAGVVGTLLVRRSLRPLDAVAEAAVSVSELELSRGEVGDIPRVDAAHTDERTEVGQVGAALNRMLENVESSLVARHESEIQVRQFVADASHELRTPLASIRGYAELVRRSPDAVPPDTLRALDRIESESGRMSALVEDLLLLARLDAGRPLADAPVDLTALALDALADAHAASPAHRWELDLPGGGGADDDGIGGGVDGIGLGEDGAGDEDEDVPDVVVRGDEARLRQVLTNLLANARVHTPPGTRIVLGLRIVPGRPGADGGPAQAGAINAGPTTGPGAVGRSASAGPDGVVGRSASAGPDGVVGGPEGAVVVSVADDGPGIPAALRSTLFQRFTRGDSARNRAGGSTGLGLAIAQSIVAAHGGTITVRSRTADEAAARNNPPPSMPIAPADHGIGPRTTTPAVDNHLLDATDGRTGSVFEVTLPRA